MKNFTNSSTQALAFDDLSSFNEARRAFKQFCRTPFTEESETSLTFLVTFDVVVTNAVDEFRFIIGELKDGERYIIDKEAEVGQDVHRR